MTVNGDEPPMPDPGVNSLYRHCEHCFPFWLSDFLLEDRLCPTGTQMWRSGTTVLHPIQPESWYL